MINQEEKENFFGLEQGGTIAGISLPNELNIGVQEKDVRTFSSEHSISHPKYYTHGTIETWDFIKDKRLDFDRGSAIKYIVRAGRKNRDTEIEDLRKAINFINHEIDYLSGLVEQGEPWNPNLTHESNRKEDEE